MMICDVKGCSEEVDADKFDMPIQVEVWQGFMLHIRGDDLCDKHREDLKAILEGVLANFMMGTFKKKDLSAEDTDHDKIIV